MKLVASILFRFTSTWSSCYGTGHSELMRCCLYMNRHLVKIIAAGPAAGVLCRWLLNRTLASSGMHDYYMVLSVLTLGKKQNKKHRDILSASTSWPALKVHFESKDSRARTKHHSLGQLELMRQGHETWIIPAKITLKYFRGDYKMLLITPK